MPPKNAGLSITESSDNVPLYEAVIGIHKTSKVKEPFIQKQREEICVGTETFGLAFEADYEENPNYTPEEINLIRMALEQHIPIPGEDVKILEQAKTALDTSDKKIIALATIRWQKGVDQAGRVEMLTGIGQQGLLRFPEATHFFVRSIKRGETYRAALWVGETDTGEPIDESCKAPVHGAALLRLYRDLVKNRSFLTKFVHYVRQCTSEEYRRKF